VLNRIKKNIFSLSVGVVIVYLFLIIGSVIFIGKNIKFNYELETFFPEGDPHLEYYLKHIERFESDHDVVLMSFTSDNGIFDKKFLEGLQSFKQNLDSHSCIRQVVSPLSIGRLKPGPLSPVKLPFFHYKDESRYEEDSIRLANTNHFIKNFLSLKSSTCCLIAKVKPGIGIETSTKLVSEIKAMAEKNVPGTFRMAGRVRAQTYIIQKMQYEFLMLAAVTALVLVVFLFYSFRSFFGVFMPVFVVITGVMLTLSCILLITGSLNLLSVMLPTVIFIVGVSDAVHVLNAYYGYLEQGIPSREAVFETLSEIGAAVFLTAITSAIGFFTLFTIQIRPVAEFGIYAGAGILITFFVSFTLLIAALILLKPGKSKRPAYLAEANWIMRLFDFVSHKKKWVLAGTIVVVCIFSFGVSKIEVNNFFTEDFRKNDQYKQDFDFFDANLGGVRPLELSVHVVDTSKNVFSPVIVNNIEKIEQFFKDSLHLQYYVSSNNLIKTANQVASNNSERFELPANDSLWNKTLYWLDRMEADELKALVSLDKKYARISGRIPDIGAIEARKMNNKIMAFVKRELPADKMHIKITGISEVVDSNVRNISSNMLDGMALEILMVGLFMGLLFRSVKTMLLSLIPNVLPLLMIAGLMGFIGVNINVSTSIIFSIAFGICVDDTIHMLTRFYLEKKKGYDNETAMKNSFRMAGKAVVVTSLVLFAGFAVLMLSTFKGIFNTGYLIGLTLIFALACDLFILPILFGKWRK
jgi:uncharacterized protein